MEYQRLSKFCVYSRLTLKAELGPTTCCSEHWEDILHTDLCIRAPVPVSSIYNELEVSHFGSNNRDAL